MNKANNPVSAPASAAPPLFRAARAGSLIGLSTIGALVVGFFLQLAIAYRFGASGNTDAFFMAQGTSELLAKILLGGSLASVFLPMFVEHLTHNRPEQAWKLANHLLHLAAVVAAIVLGLLALFTDQIVSFIAPGFSPEVHLTTVRLLRIMLPGFFFLLLSDLLIAILHSFRVFGIPAATRVIPPAVTLACVLLLAPRYGVTTLAIGTLLGATINIVLLCIALLRAGYVYEPVFSLRDPDVRRVIRLVAPFVLSILAAQGAGIIYRILVSHFPEGSLSALKFGEKIFQMTNTLFLSSITTVAFPAFSRAVAARAWDEVRSTMRQAIRVMAFFGVPLMIGIILLRTPLVRLLYERGSFTPEDTAATAAVLGLFLIGLIANGVSSLLGHLALALKVTRVSVLATIGAQICSIILFLILAPRMGIRGLALASALSPFVLTTLYVVFLRRQVKGLMHAIFDPGLLAFVGSGAALGIAIILVKRFLPLPASQGLADAALVVTSAFAGSMIYLLISKFLKIPEIRNAQEIVYYALRRHRS